MRISTDNSTLPLFKIYLLIFVSYRLEIDTECLRAFCFKAHLSLNSDIILSHKTHRAEVSIFEKVLVIGIESSRRLYSAHLDCVWNLGEAEFVLEVLRWNDSQKLFLDFFITQYLMSGSDVSPD